MQNAVRIVIEANLDQDTLSEISVIRNLRLQHYRNIEKFPESAMTALKKAGLSEETSVQDLQERATLKIQQIESRLLDPNTIYEDELAFYVETLSAEEA